MNPFVVVAFIRIDDEALGKSCDKQCAVSVDAPAVIERRFAVEVLVDPRFALDDLPLERLTYDPLGTTLS